MKKLIIMLLAIGFFSCKNETKTTSSDYESDTVEETKNRVTEFPEPDIVLRLRAQKGRIDELLNTKSLSIEVFVKQRNDSKIIKIVDSKFPDSVETTYNVWTDSLDHIRLIGEFPFSESGDWAISYLHYFDTNDKTCAFERYTGFYNSICTDNLAHENIVDYYDRDFNRVNRDYWLKDSKGNALVKDSCMFNYDYPYEVESTLNNYIEKHKLTQLLGGQFF